MRIQYQDVKVFENPINDLLSILSSSTGVVDLQPEFFRFTLATTTSLIFGEPFAGLNSTDHEAFAEDFNYCSLISAIRSRLADFCFLYSPFKFKKACQQVKRYAMYYVDHALKDMKENGEQSASERHPFILDIFRELQDPVLVRDQLMNVLIAGRDTTACLMSWALYIPSLPTQLCFCRDSMLNHTHSYLLVRHPASLERLRQEIRSINTDGQDLTRAQINKMAYLKCVLNESKQK